MSEYWKSVPRKFCDFCKCWITDNKPSVEFHERGKRHKENVELRLKEVRKKSLKKSEEDEKLQKDMDKLEKAALEAFKKDLRDNPELAAKYGVSLEAKPDSNNQSLQEKVTVPQKAKIKAKVKAKKEKKVKEWCEAVTPEGHHYYWNNVTGESKWDAPDDYLSLVEQEALDITKKTEKIVTQELNIPENQLKKTPAADVKKETESPAQETLPTSCSKQKPGNSWSPYGAWTAVKEEVGQQSVIFDDTSKPPALEDIPMPADASSVPHPSPNKSKFKEKTVTSLYPESGETVAFKKRKIASGARNVRQKNDFD